MHRVQSVPHREQSIARHLAHSLQLDRTPTRNETTNSFKPHTTPTRTSATSGFKWLTRRGVSPQPLRRSQPFKRESTRHVTEHARAKGRGQQGISSFVFPVFASCGLWAVPGCREGLSGLALACVSEWLVCVQCVVVCVCA